MAEDRITGAVDWYDKNVRYGVILDSQHKEHFVHFSNIRDKGDLTPGMKVSFLSRVRTRGKGGLEAYDVEILKSDDRAATPPPKPAPAKIPVFKQPEPRPSRWPAKPATPPPQPTSPPPSQVSTQDIAREALRQKAARRREGVQAPVEQFPRGTRVHHPFWGYGIVVLPALHAVSIRLEQDQRTVVDVPRTEVRLAPQQEAQATAPKVIEKPTATAPAVAPTPSPRARTLDLFLNQLRRDVQGVLAEEQMDAIAVYQREESRQPGVSPAPLQIAPVIGDLFERVEGITDFYSHQIETRQHLLSGKHVVITTPTASGKTESYNPTILETLLQNPGARALYIFPLVALGEDQVHRLRRLNDALPAYQRMRIGIYNSSVDLEEKNETLRAENRILVTTPDSLHYIFLPKPYPNWQRFYRNLRYVVLDEAHVYRGVLGANMANIVRRLLIRCRREGNPRFPQLVVSSATVRSPAGLAHQLTGLPEDEFTVVDRSGAPQPTRHFLATREDIHDLVDLCADLLEIETTDARTGKKRAVRTIVFLRSINGVKSAADALRKQLLGHRKGELAGKVAEFYAERADKRDVFVQLREGKIRCVFATTALMAGIDIGSLDVAIVKNFPGLVMDARQMFGRAGRAGEGAAIFIARRSDPFDQFYFERPELLFSGDTEEVIANPENPYLLAAHIKCAAQVSANASYKNREGPLAGRWAYLFGEMGRDVLNLLEKEHQIAVRSGFYEMRAGSPHDEEPLSNLRSMETNEYVLVTPNGSRLQELEKKRATNAYRDAHPDAIVWCNGNRYRVVNFDTISRQILCEAQEDTNLRTKGLPAVDLARGEDVSERWIEELDLLLGNGEVSVTTSVKKYYLYRTTMVMRCRSRRCRHETPNLDTRKCPVCGSAVRTKQVEKVVDTLPIRSDQPLESILNTRASWLEFAPAMRASFEQHFWPRWMDTLLANPEAEPEIMPRFSHAVHSLLHGVLKAFPDRVRCDRDEINGLHEVDPVGARVYVYDNFPGGLGLADEFYHDPLAFLRDGLDLIERCNCDDDDGCPVCLNHFGCSSFNAELSKFAGRFLLRLVLGLPTREVLDDLKDYVHVVVPPSKIVTRGEFDTPPVSSLDPRQEFDELPF